MPRSLSSGVAPNYVVRGPFLLVFFPRFYVVPVGVLECPGDRGDEMAVHLVVPTAPKRDHRDDRIRPVRGLDPPLAHVLLPFAEHPPLGVGGPLARAELGD